MHSFLQRNEKQFSAKYFSSLPSFCHFLVPPVNLLPSPWALTSLHLYVSSLLSPASNPWYEEIARVEGGLQTGAWIHTHTKHTHIPCCVYTVHTSFSEFWPNLQSLWLFLFPIHKVKEKWEKWGVFRWGCLDHPQVNILHCGHCSGVGGGTAVHMQTPPALRTILCCWRKSLKKTVWPHAAHILLVLQHHSILPYYKIQGLCFGRGDVVIDQST